MTKRDPTSNEPRNENRLGKTEEKSALVNVICPSCESATVALIPKRAHVLDIDPILDRPVPARADTAVVTKCSRSHQFRVLLLKQ